MSPVSQVHPLCSSDRSGSRNVWMCAGQTQFQATHVSSQHHLTGGKDLTAKGNRCVWNFLGLTSKHSHSNSENDANNSMVNGYIGLLQTHSRWVSAVIIWRCAACSWGDKLFHAVGLGDLGCPAVMSALNIGQEEILHQ